MSTDEYRISHGVIRLDELDERNAEPVLRVDQELRTAAELAAPRLAPCRRCGGVAVLEDWCEGWESGTTIRCLVCGARASEGVEGGYGWRDRAIKKWNRRA